MPEDLKVFIIGSPRSGTSITYFAMREIFRLKGRGESHVMPIFLRMVHQFYTYSQDFTSHPGVLAGELDTKTFKEGLYPYIRSFYAKAYPGGGFVDKTPGAEAVRGCDFIYGAFPDARVILLQRNGIEVVNSYRTKFQASLESAFLSWKQVVAASQQALATYKSILVIDQFDLANTPEVAAARICEHLDRRDLTPLLSRFFADRRVESQSTHDWQRRQTLDDVDWSSGEKDLFVSICGDSMKALGYAW